MAGITDLLGLGLPGSGFTISGPGGDTVPADSFVGQQVAPQAAPQPAPAYQPPHGIKAFLGMLGDAMLTAHGLPPAYQNRVNQERENAALSGFLTNPDQAIQQLMQIDPKQGIQLYGQVHPQKAVPDVIAEMQAAGIDPTSDEGKQIIRNHIGGGDKNSDPAFVKELAAAGIDPKSPEGVRLIYAHNSPAGYLITPPGGGGGETLPTFPTPQAAQAAGLKPGARFKSPAGQTYTVPGGQTPSASGNFSVDDVMPALTHIESRGNGMAVSPKGALGSTQLMPPTAQEMAGNIGLPFRPELLRSNDPEALQYQHQLGRAYLQEGYRKTGNIRDALRYYNGGPNFAAKPQTNAYADAVLSRASRGQ